MNILLNISVAVNIILILVFCAVFALSQKETAEPKLKAGLGTGMAVALFLYLICLTALSLTGFIIKDYIMASLAFFVAMPFIIGHFADFKSLKIFSTIQLFSFALSLYVLIVCLISA